MRISLASLAAAARISVRLNVMEENIRIYSYDRQASIEVVSNCDGTFSLKEFVIKFDEEEGRSYEVEVLSSQSGIYADVDMATKEAKRLLGLII